MTRTLRKKTEELTKKLYEALEGLSEIHGDPRHIGAGYRSDGNRKTVFVYVTNPRVATTEEGEIRLPQQVPYSVAILTHQIPMPEVTEEEPLRFSRKNRHAEVAAALALA